MTVAQALADASAKLAHIDGGARDARWLLAAAMRVSRDKLTLMAGEEVTPDCAATFADYIHLRASHVPVSHILGEREFYGRKLYVTADVLDPRPETETLIAAALEGEFSTVLDLGTGSGAICATLLAERPAATGLATDVSIGALAIAEKNARRLAVTKRVRVIRSDWFAGVEGAFDLIVSNPPYIPASDMAGLAPELSHEPEIALTDGGDGLSAYTAIFRDSAAHLAPGGRVIVEFGAGQGADIHQIALAHGWEDVSFRTDLDGRERVLVAKAPLWSRFSTQNCRMRNK